MDFLIVLSVVVVVVVVWLSLVEATVCLMVPVRRTVLILSCLFCV